MTTDKAGEPIHVHICMGKLSPNTTKMQLTRTGQRIAANNSSRIPKSDLNESLYYLCTVFLIGQKRKEHFCEKEIQFFC